MCSCAGIGQDILLLSQLIETKSPSPKKKTKYPRSKERPATSKHHLKKPSIQRILRKTRSITNPKKDQASSKHPKKNQKKI